jgi:hypothetical protein
MHNYTPIKITFKERVAELITYIPRTKTSPENADRDSETIRETSSGHGSE